MRLDDGRDQALIRRAARESWPIDPALKGQVVQRMGEIVKRRTKTTVVLVDGKPVEVEKDADRESIAAARVLVACARQNQADDHLAEKYARLDAGQRTEHWDQQSAEQLLESIRRKIGGVGNQPSPE